MARSGIELRVIETDGSVDNLQRLLAAEDAPDLALVQGGIATDEQKDAVIGLGSMFYEPVWLLGPRGKPGRPLNQLQGQRIGVGPPDSGTYFLAVRMLTQSGVRDENADLIGTDLKSAAAQLRAGELDLLFLVGAEDGPLLRGLTGDQRIQVQDLPHAAAYARIDRSLTALTLPAGVLDLARGVPREDLSLVAATANLVAHPDIHPALVDLLLEAAVDVHGAGGLFADPGAFPTPLHSDFRLSSDAVRHYENGPPFLQRYLPFWAATWIDRTKVMIVPLLALLLPLIKVLPPVYAWRVRRRIIRWYVALRRIDLELETGPRDPDRLADFAQRLGEIESEVAQVDVPLSYADQLYNLRLHIQALQHRLATVAAETAGGKGMPIPG
ncbi:MAG: TAXI family TRAP transporter solute-binding subunit [Thiohalocapsa sp.]